MTVNKYKPQFENGNLKKDFVPYTQILTKVLQSNIDPCCLAMWVSLQSRPEEWKLSIAQLRIQFGFGKDKAYAILNKLIELKLIERIQEKDESQRYLSTTYYVKNGQEFLSCLESDNFLTKNTPFPDEPLPENPEPVNQDHIYNRLLNIKDIKNIKDKRYCSSDDEHEKFERFWNLYPRKQNKKGTLKVWVKNNLDEKIDEIESHLMKRLENEWRTQDIKYIPLPTTFLNGERWTDDLTKHQKYFNSKSDSKVGRDVITNFFKKEGLL
jgi:hypothetical protein